MRKVALASLTGPRRRSTRHGAILVLFCLVAVPLLAALGLALDGSHLYFVRRQAQAAADSAAWGGAKELIRGVGGDVVAAGRFDARRMNFDDAASDIAVAINNPPLAGAHAGDADYVEAVVERQLPSTFLQMFAGTSTVRARAVAGVETDFSGPCVLALDPAARGAITVSGGAVLNAPGCEVISSSVDPGSITANGGGCINAAIIGYPSAGGSTQNGQGCLNGKVGPVIPPPDPFAGLAEPNTPGDPAAGTYSTQSSKRLKLNGGALSIQPGIYKGGIQVTGGILNMAPGTYIVDGMDVNSGEVNGCGVTIYNTGNGSLKNVRFGAQAVSRLTAPTSGYYANMLFFNGRSANRVNQEMTIDGGAGSFWDGVIYVPTNNLDFVGNTLTNLTGPTCGNGQAIFNMVVAQTIRFTGTSNVNLDWAGSGRTPTQSRVSMVE